jgi:hemerythrin
MTTRDTESNPSGTEERTEAPAPEAIPGDRPLSLIAEAVLDDRTELFVTAARLRVLTSTCGNMHPAELIALANRLEEFEDLLLLHFAAEEAEGFVGSLTTDEPRQLERIDQLQQEHGSLVEELDRLQELARSCSAEYAELPAALERFLARLDIHDREETSVMEELVLLSDASD